MLDWGTGARSAALACRLSRSPLPAGGQTPSKREELCESGLPDADVCGVDWEDDSDDPATRARRSTLVEAWSRGRWLLGLLVLQVLVALPVLAVDARTKLCGS